MVELDPYNLPYLLNPPYPYLYYILYLLPSDESIMEFMSLDERTWKYLHHRYSFLPHYQLVQDQFESLVSYDIVTTPQSLVLIQNVESKGNLSNINKRNPVDILVKPGFVEHIHLGHNCSTP